MLYWALPRGVRGAAALTDRQVDLDPWPLLGWELSKDITRTYSSVHGLLSLMHTEGSESAIRTVRFRKLFL